MNLSRFASTPVSGAHPRLSIAAIASSWSLSASFLASSGDPPFLIMACHSFLFLYLSVGLAMNLIQRSSSS